MLDVVDCVYRVHEKGEILRGQFDIKLGVIQEIPDKLSLDVSKYYNYMEGNYHEYKATPIETLYTMILRIPSALAVIEYNRIGVIVIFRHKHASYLFEKQMFHRVYIFSEEQFKFSCLDIGLVKTPAVSLGYMQRLAHLIVDLSGKEPVVHTRYGKCVVAFRYDKSESHSMSRFLEMCSCDDAYASIEYKGKTRFVGVVNNKLKVIGG